MPRTKPAPLSKEEDRLIRSLCRLIEPALEERWPLVDRHGFSRWAVQKSPSQDGEALRLAVGWMEGPEVAEVAQAVEEMVGPVLPPGQPIVLCVRRAPEPNHRKPPLHRIERTA